MTKKEIRQLKMEFGIHFKNSPDELRFLETFIDELITENYQKDIIRLNKALNKQCEDKVKEAIKWQKGEIKKILVAYAFMEKPVSITKLFKEIDKL